MLRFLFGLLVGAILLGGGAMAWVLLGDGCAARCGDHTRCEHHRCVGETPAKPAPPSEPTRRRPTRHLLPGAAAEVQLKPGDDLTVSQGEALGRPEHIDLTQPDVAGRELSQEDLDRVVRPAEPAILHCITTAVGDAPLEQGHVEVGLRVERDGQVKRVRVQAPGLLQRRGLTACIRPRVTALRFPPSGGASVVTYPFELK